MVALRRAYMNRVPQARVHLDIVAANRLHHLDSVDKEIDFLINIFSLISDLQSVTVLEDNTHSQWGSDGMASFVSSSSLSTYACSILQDIGELTPMQMSGEHEGDRSAFRVVLAALASDSCNTRPTALSAKCLDLVTCSPLHALSENTRGRYFARPCLSSVTKVEIAFFRSSNLDFWQQYDTYGFIEMLESSSITDLTLRFGDYKDEEDCTGRLRNEVSNVFIEDFASMGLVVPCLSKLRLESLDCRCWALEAMLETMVPTLRSLALVNLLFVKDESQACLVGFLHGVRDCMELDEILLDGYLVNTGRQRWDICQDWEGTSPEQFEASVLGRLQSWITNRDDDYACPIERLSLEKTSTADDFDTAYEYFMCDQDRSFEAQHVDFVE